MYWVREAPPPANERSHTFGSIDRLYCRSSSQFKPLGVCQKASSRRRIFRIPKRERKRIVPFDLACDINCGQSCLFIDENVYWSRSDLKILVLIFLGKSEK